MTRYAIVADLNRCVGCQTCTAACKHQNATAPGVMWRKVLDFEAGTFPDVRRAFVPVGCMHCDEPPCLDVCPSTATKKRADGIVTIDYDICIGCAYCAVACPYDARYRVDEARPAYNGKGKMRHEAVREDPARLGVAQKCTFCVDRIDAGIKAGLVPGTDPEATPACVNSCIAQALTFGDIDDPDSNVSKLLRENRTFQMHEELGTGPGIFYLWDRGREGVVPDQSPEFVPDPVGLDRVSPRLQKNWDWRAAANFVFGGAGTGLMLAAALDGLVDGPSRLLLFLALALVGAGLLCVWLEIGRPWRFFNVYRHARRSWMTREALAALPYFAFGGLGFLLANEWLALIAAGFGLFFVYAQGRILHAAKGIPTWRSPRIVPLIVLTGLTEGLAALTIVGPLVGAGASSSVYAAAMLILLVALRLAAWRAWRHGLEQEGVPKASLRALDASGLSLSTVNQIAVVALGVASFVLPGLLPLAGLAALLTGWAFKYRLVTRAAHTQGYALARMPARGGGKAARGIKPGWWRAA